MWWAEYFSPCSRNITVDEIFHSKHNFFSWYCHSPQNWLITISMHESRGFQTCSSRQLEMFSGFEQTPYLPYFEFLHIHQIKMCFRHLYVATHFKRFEFPPVGWKLQLTYVKFYTFIIELKLKRTKLKYIIYCNN